MWNRYPEDWSQVPLQEIVERFISGGTPRTTNSDYWGGTVPWITGADAERRLATTARKHVTEQGVRDSSTSIVPEGNILLVTRTGVGKVSIAGVDIAISQDLTGIVPDRDRVSPIYLYRQLKHLAPELQRLSQGTIILGIRREEVESISIPLPPLTEQRRIAEILDAADEAIGRSERVIAKLREVKRGLLHDLLTRGLDAEGNLRDPEAHPEAFKDSPLGRIPQEWEILSLADVAAVDRGKFTHRPRNDPDYYGGDYPFIQTGDIASAEGGVITSYSQTLNERGRSVSSVFPTGTIAITIAANIADTAILGLPMYFPDSIVGAVVNSPHNNRYVELCIQRAQSRLEAQAPQSAQKNINLGTLRPLPIPVPTPDEQDRIADTYEALIARTRAEEATLDKLRQVKHGLMDDLLTGRVRVGV